MVLKSSMKLNFVSGSMELKENDIEIININEPSGVSAEKNNAVLILSIDGDEH